ncbi:MAG: 23S rRNA (adenine(2503)-C(2))-methyltransferase RlmN [Candidatus Fermentibacteraceae bacterium]|nr:23S rRNA (adenine(2503)-C(2))-methyltransferase RlmN [Candidatus Fermentibacteraceae bacterium]
MLRNDDKGRILISGLTYEQLRFWLSDSMNLKPFRANQIFSWIHQRGITEFQLMTNISRSIREQLETNAIITSLRTDSSLSAEDGTIKLSYLLSDDNRIESVLIPEPPRLTACLSTQVGCRLGCTFCQTGKMGLKRNLTTDEIVSQLYQLRDSTETRISNVVFMGMGEPMDNFDNVRDALSIISDDRGICIGSRKITVSTVGLPGGIEKLTRLPGQYGLAVSLHSAVEKTRKMLVPASGALPLYKLKQDILEYNQEKGRRVTLEYCLIEGINDTIEEAQALVEFSKDLECKINLLLYNSIDGADLRRPSSDTVEKFMSYLYPRCQAVTLRRSRGADVAAACGQLGT